jgi:iron complex outermembrane receptor protein
MGTHIARPRFRTRWVWLCATASFAALAAGAANAQHADGAAAKPAAAEGAVSEVVVTAQRRAERVMDVPLSVSAFSAEALAGAGVADTSALQVATPGLIYSKEGSSVQFYIRGVGNEVPLPGAESSVAFYVDGIYVSQMIGSFDDFADLDHVEVLQGPQGTLYGRNALGGAINITTKKPSRDRYVADVEATYGNYNRAQAKVYVSGPLNDRIAFSLGGTRVSTHGWVLNAFTGKHVENENYYSLRFKLAADLGENTHATLAVDRFWRHDTRNQVFGAANALPVAAVLPQASVLAAGLPPGPLKGILASLPDRPVQFADGKTVVYNDADPVERDAVNGVSLTLTHSFDHFEATSLTAYRDLTAYSRADADGTNRPIQTIYSDPQRGRTFSQDVHLASSQKLLGVSWLAGASYFRDHSGYSPLELSDIRLPLAGLPPTIAINGQIETDAIAGYAQGVYDLTDQFSLTLGLRYNNEKKKVLRQDTIIPAFGLTLHNPGAPSEKTWDSLAVHAGVQFKPTPGWMLYAALDQGFKSGLFDVTDPDPPVRCTTNASGFCLVPVNQEKINAFQAGAKGRLLDGRADVELAGFYYDYKNLQTSTVSPSGSPIIQNAASARIGGAELKVRAALTDNLSLQAAGTALFEANYEKFIGRSFVADFVNGGFLPVTADMSHNRMPRAPRFSGSLGPTYELPIGAAKLILNGNLYYTSSYFLDPSHSTRVGGYTLLNASARYVAGNGVSVSLWGRNLSNKRFEQSALLLSSKLVTWNEPRMYGVTLSYEY